MANRGIPNVPAARWHRSLDASHEEKILRAQLAAQKRSPKPNFSSPRMLGVAIGGSPFRRLSKNRRGRITLAKVP